MARYSVTLPIAGYAVVEVEAADEKSAIGEALNCVDINHIETWDAYKILCEGNVLRAPLNKAGAELLEEDD